MGRDPSLVKLGRTVRALREGKGWSQEELAERAELHRNYESSTERGERNIALKNILKLARALGLKASDLLKKAGL